MTKIVETKTVKIKNLEITLYKDDRIMVCFERSYPNNKYIEDNEFTLYNEEVLALRDLLLKTVLVVEN